jgi:hypothetical protein
MEFEFEYHGQLTIWNERNEVVFDKVIDTRNVKIPFIDF